jgi:hypothetical protein
MSGRLRDEQLPDVAPLPALPRWHDTDGRSRSCHDPCHADSDR